MHIGKGIYRPGGRHPDGRLFAAKGDFAFFEKLSGNTGVIASFSRAPAESLSALTDEEFNRVPGNAVKAIAAASTC